MAKSVYTRCKLSYMQRVILVVSIACSASGRAADFATVDRVAVARRLPPIGQVDADWTPASPALDYGIGTNDGDVGRSYGPRVAYVELDESDFTTVPVRYEPSLDQLPFPAEQHGLEKAADCYYPEQHTFQLGPRGFIYKNYLAGPKESRMSTQWVHATGDANLQNSTLGGRVGIFRYGTCDPFRPAGFQIDVEGSAQLRQDWDEELDVRSADYRFGFPLTWGNQRHQFKLAWYHISSHLGDEFLDKNPNYPLYFQSSDFVVLGYSLYPTDSLRLYGEVGFGYKTDARDPWELQFGVDWVQRGPTPYYGTPFVAANAYLREELNFGGSFNFEAGWAWRSHHTAGLLRLGFQYYAGASNQYAFSPNYEELAGLGVWYDF